MAPETPKTVSSRLLTMKFMQRAVASASSSPDTESHSSKKRKIDHSPAQGRVSALIDQASIQAALDDQEAKRQAALARHSSSDTHWILNTTLNKGREAIAPKSPMNIVYVGYGEIDSSNESGAEDAPQSGRTSTRVAKPVPKQKTENRKPSNADDESSEESSSEADDSSPRRKRRNQSATRDSQDHSSRSRSRSKYMPSQESIKANDFRHKRKQKEVRLNTITSISKGGGSSPALACYNCKQSGHKAANCPKASSSHSRK